MIRKAQNRRGKVAGNLLPVWQVAQRIYQEFSDDRVPAVAGGITFFILLALFPAIASVVSLYGLFAHRATIVKDLDLVSGFLPGGAISILNAELHRLISQKASRLNLAFVFSSIIALWSASGGFKALIDGLNIAYEVRETRSFVRLSASALIFTLAGIAFAAIAIGLGLLVPAALDRLPISDALTLVLQFLMWPISFVVCAVILTALYHYGPDRPEHPWRWVNWGSLTASALWLFGTRLFSFYVQNFGSYDRVYGDLGAAVGFLTWVWLSLVILLLGAEINCELDRRQTQTKSQAPH